MQVVCKRKLLYICVMNHGNDNLISYLLQVADNTFFSSPLSILEKCFIR